MQAIKKRPILFSPPMVQAILAGRKTMTRRVIKSAHESGLLRICKAQHTLSGAGYYKGRMPESLDWDEKSVANILCPYGEIGDIIWVRETWCYNIFHGQISEMPRFIYKATDVPMEEGLKWRPSIHMPYDACRLFLRITDIRVERLQDISEEDAISEGVTDREIYPIYPLDFKVCPACGGDGTHTALGPNLGVMEVDCTTCDTYKNRFKILWENIHNPESWQKNPWVWVVSFERINKPE